MEGQGGMIGLPVDRKRAEQGRPGSIVELAPDGVGLVTAGSDDRVDAEPDGRIGAGKTLETRRSAP